MAQNRLRLLLRSQWANKVDVWRVIGQAYHVPACYTDVTVFRLDRTYIHWIRHRSRVILARFLLLILENVHHLVDSWVVCGRVIVWLEIRVRHCFVLNHVVVRICVVWLTVGLSRGQTFLHDGWSLLDFGGVRWVGDHHVWLSCYIVLVLKQLVLPLHTVCILMQVHALLYLLLLRSCHVTELIRVFSWVKAGGSDRRGIGSAITRALVFLHSLLL
jgi:hypothetical protein